MSRKKEMSYKPRIKKILQMTNDTIEGLPIITDTLDYKYCLVHKIIDSLKRACVYYDPKSEEFFDNLDIIVVDSPTINAFSAVGGVIVIYTGIIDYYNALLRKHQIANLEEVFTFIE